MIPPSAPAPRPLCAAFATLLPLISSGALEDDEAAATREHVAGCAWRQQELAHYKAVDDALRRQFGAAAHGPILPFPFDSDDGEDQAEDYAFTLEDTLEGPMVDRQDSQRSSITNRSSRWETGRRGLSPRATAIASIAAALMLAVIVTTIYTQFAARRTTSSPSATTTAGAAFSKVITAPNATGGLTIMSDGSLWFTEYADVHSKIGRLAPDGKLTEFPVPVADHAKHGGVGDLTFGPHGNLWFGSTSSTNRAYQGLISSIIRMTPDGAMTTFPLPSGVSAGPLVAASDGARWFTEAGANKLGRMTVDGQVTEDPVAPTDNSGNTFVRDLCVGSDGALWHTWFQSDSIGRMTLDGKAQNFTVPYRAGGITSGPGGALWYVQSEPTTANPSGFQLRAGFIGHLTTAGVASEAQIAPSLRVTDLVKGRDGAMWFSASDRTDSTLKLGRLSATGDVKVYPTNEYAAGGVLAAAPGVIWMLNSGNNSLWRYRLPK